MIQIAIRPERRESWSCMVTASQRIIVFINFLPTRWNKLHLFSQCAAFMLEMPHVDIEMQSDLLPLVKNTVTFWVFVRLAARSTFYYCLDRRFICSLIWFPTGESFDSLLLSVQLRNILFEYRLKCYLFLWRWQSWIFSIITLVFSITQLFGNELMCLFAAKDILLITYSS